MSPLQPLDIRRRRYTWIYRSESQGEPIIVDSDDLALQLLLIKQNNAPHWSGRTATSRRNRDLKRWDHEDEGRILLCMYHTSDTWSIIITRKCQLSKITCKVVGFFGTDDLTLGTSAKTGLIKSDFLHNSMRESQSQRQRYRQTPETDTETDSI